MKPDRNRARSEIDRVNRERFAEAAQETRGLEGTTERNGLRVPISAAHVGDTVAEEGTPVDNERGPNGRALQRLREVIGL